jgi:hypothetical protein
MMRLAAAIATNVGLCLCIIGWLDSALFESTVGGEITRWGGLLLAAGIAASVVLIRRKRMTVSTLLIVFLGCLPFAGFGGFLWWQIQLSKERSAACEAGSAEACLSFGKRKVRRGEVEAGLPRLRRACELGSADGCFMAGGLAPKATGVEWLAKACDLGDPRGCARAAQLLRTGDGVMAAPARGCELAQRGCAQGSAEACAEAGYCSGGEASGSAAEPRP